MTGYVADPLSIEGFIEYFHMFDDNQIDESFSNFLPIYLHSCKCSKEKSWFLGTFIDKLEKDIKVLEAQIQSDSFHCQDQSFENFFLPKQEKKVLPFDDMIKQCKQEYLVTEYFKD